jgi:hypothetical protein
VTIQDRRHKCAICGKDLYSKRDQKGKKWYYEVQNNKLHDGYHVHLDQLIKYSKLRQSRLDEFNECLVTTFSGTDELSKKETW